MSIERLFFRAANTKAERGSGSQTWPVTSRVCRLQLSRASRSLSQLVAIRPAGLDLGAACCDGSRRFSLRRHFQCFSLFAPPTIMESSTKTILAKAASRDGGWRRLPGSVRCSRLNRHESDPSRTTVLGISVSCYDFLGVSVYSVNCS
jgi:hypothetical protein